jgi:hypothetical protein
MKNLIKSLLMVLFLWLASCYGIDNDTSQICNGNCNVFTGRIYTENNTGIPDVEITLTYKLNQIGANYERIIAKSKTDRNGNYNFEGFIKDNEFNTGFFHLTVDESKIENSITNEFYKPSELVNEVAPRINKCLIPNLVSRTQITNIDYKIPYKTYLTVNLNNFNLTTPNDQFGIGNRIEYGFQVGYNRFLTKQTTSQGFGYANGLNTTLTVPGVFGENYLTIYKFKSGLVDNILQTITINNPNTNPPLNYSY